MLKLTIFHNENTEGYLVRFKKGTKISIVVKNPMFSNAGLFSYLVKVYRDENDHIFKHISALDNVEEAALTFKLQAGTDTFAEGDVVISYSDNEELEFYLKSGNSSVAYFLQNTLMNETDIWGEYDFESDYAQALDGIYPQYPVNYPPVVLGSGDVINKYSFSDSQINREVVIKETISPTGYVIERVTEINHNPAVYAKHIIDKLISGLGYRKTTDDLKAKHDFDRILLFSPVGFTQKADAPTVIKNWLPATSILNWLDDFKTRFNTAVIFSPFLFEADVVSIDDAIQLTPTDWTDKFISKSNISPVQEKKILFEQESEYEENLYTIQELEEKVYGTVATMSDLDNSGSNRGRIFFVEDIERYLQYVFLPASNNQVSIELDSIGNVTNSNTTADTENLIAEVYWPAEELEIDSAWGYGVYVRTTYDNCRLITRLVYDDNGTETNIGYDAVDLTKATTEDYKNVQNFNILLGANYTLDADRRLILRFYCLSTDAGSTISIKEQVNTFYGSLVLNKPYITWQEVGMLQNMQYGEQDGKIEFKPDSRIPVNARAAMDGYIFEMPQSNLDIKDDEQSKFEYLIYRGKKPDLKEGIVSGGYCNADILDIDKEDYTNKLDTPASPSLSLSWHGNNGLLAMLFKNRLRWERYYKRSIELKMELTISDIIDHKIYKPFKVSGIHYIIDELSFDIDEEETISNTKIKGYTL